MSGWPPRAYSALAAAFLLLGPRPASPQSSARTTPAAITNVSVSDFVFTPANVTIAQGGTVEWDFVGPMAHTATDQTGLQLFDSGTKLAGSMFSFTFPVAATYQYHCTIHPLTMKGTVAVPLTVTPTSAPLGSTFTVTWGSTPPPAGYVVDIEVKAPNQANFHPFVSGAMGRKGSGVPTSVGTWMIRARLRRTSNGATSLFSPVLSITVT